MECRFFKAPGGCAFGTRCRFLHNCPPGSELSGSEAGCGGGGGGGHTRNQQQVVVENTRLVAIAWPLGRCPRLEDELALRPILVTSDMEHSRGRDLPAARLARIEAAGGAAGLDLRGCLSLRRLLIREAVGSAAFYEAERGMGDAAAAKAHAKAFEGILLEFLRGAGASCRDEAALAATGSALTPDVLCEPPVLINGKRVAWLDCKTFYGAACLARAGGESPVAKLERQARRYCSAFGPGAFVFLSGFSADLHSEAGLSEDVLCLDASPLNKAKLPSDWGGASELLKGGPPPDGARKAGGPPSDE